MCEAPRFTRTQRTHARTPANKVADAAHHIRSDASLRAASRDLSLSLPLACTLHAIAAEPTQTELAMYHRPMNAARADETERQCLGARNDSCNSWQRSQTTHLPWAVVTASQMDLSHARTECPPLSSAAYSALSGGIRSASMKSVSHRLCDDFKSQRDAIVQAAGLVSKLR